jgi:hypothetical protein
MTFLVFRRTELVFRTHSVPMWALVAEKIASWPSMMLVTVIFLLLSNRAAVGDLLRRLERVRFPKGEIVFTASSTSGIVPPAAARSGEPALRIRIIQSKAEAAFQKAGFKLVGEFYGMHRMVNLECLECGVLSHTSLINVQRGWKCGFCRGLAR